MHTLTRVISPFLTTINKHNHDISFKNWSNNVVVTLCDLVDL